MPQLRVLELGKFVVASMAGMLLAEQGCQVTKWTYGRDPILGHWKGDELWAYYQEGKTVEQRAVSTEALIEWIDAEPDLPIILDNIRPEALMSWGVDPASIVHDHPAVWVSERSEMPGPSFDVLAQARAWGDCAPYVPIYIGDTAVGLMLAFKALAKHAQQQPGHYVIYHATSLAKLREGELVVDTGPRSLEHVPWWRNSECHYGFNAASGEYEITYGGEHLTEKAWDRQRQWRYLRHDGTGRMVI